MRRRSIVLCTGAAMLGLLGLSPAPVVTAIQPATPFYRAEEYHQEFYRKNPARYDAYRIGCRRDVRLRQLWGDVVISQGAEK